MTIVGGVICMVASWICLTMGHGSRRDSTNHLEYGVETESLHRAFAGMFIAAGWVLGAVGAYLVLRGVFG